MTSYLALARSALAKRQTLTRRPEVTKANEGVEGVKSAESATTPPSATRVEPLRAAVDASPDLRVLLGLDPLPRPSTTCRYCGGAATATHPLLRYLDGHADHGGFCPPPRPKRKPPA